MKHYYGLLSLTLGLALLEVFFTVLVPSLPLLALGATSFFLIKF